MLDDDRSAALGRTQGRKILPCKVLHLCGRSLFKGHRALNFEALWTIQSGSKSVLLSTAVATHASQRTIQGFMIVDVCPVCRYNRMDSGFDQEVKLYTGEGSFSTLNI